MEITVRKGSGNQVKCYTVTFSEGLIDSTKKSNMIILNLER